MVNHAKLFSILRARGVSAVYLRLLQFAYTKQKACVRWDHVDSEVFSIANGVRQGAFFHHTSLLAMSMNLSAFLEPVGRAASSDCNILVFSYMLMILFFSVLACQDFRK